MAKSKLTSGVTLFAGFLALSACSGGSERDDAGIKPQDTGTPDTGMMMPDTGMMPADTGVAACNPVDGTGCPSGEFCVLQINDDVGQCRTLPAMNAHEQACNMAMQDCAAGFACADIGTGSTICHKVCEPAASADACSGLVGGFNDYTCGQFVQNGTYGLCIGIDVCNPAEGPTECGANETCSLVSQDETACAPAGTSMVGGTCSPQNNCIPGAICIDFGNGAQCFDPCDANNACAGGGTCQGIVGFDWGVCQAACVPYNDTCPNGQVCSVASAQGDTACLDEGPNAIGQPCGATGNCMRGGVCVDTGGGATCNTPCDPNNDQCATGACTAVGAGVWGICL